MDSNQPCEVIYLRTLKSYLDVTCPWIIFILSSSQEKETIMCDYFQEWIINSLASLRSFLSSGFVTFYGRSFYDLYTNFCYHYSYHATLSEALLSSNCCTSINSHSSYEFYRSLIRRNWGEA